MSTLSSKAIVPFLVASLFICSVHGQEAMTTPMPKIIEKDGRFTLLVEGKPFLILGGQVHNSSAWPAVLPKAWMAIEAMHANTMEVPLYWEQIEARPGVYDFSLIDTLLIQARAHHVYLVLLWFATWKNGSNHYMPEWMKRDALTYPNVMGRDGRSIDSPSPEATATLEADTRAFTAVMKYLKQGDPQHTVIMIQVENEPGTWDSVRDYAPATQKLFEGAVPADLLKPAILKALNVPVGSAGSWQKVFGSRADEYFHAWAIARFIGQVAAAGKAVYPLPMYVNAALRDPLTNPEATNYESGGPTDNVIPIWKAAAPAIDLLAPDIYLSGTERVLKVIDLYTRPDNPLFVPEAGLIPENAKYLYEVLARGGIGFSPFGIDDNGAASKVSMTDRLMPYGQAYAVAGSMMRELARWSFEGRIRAAVERDASDHAGDHAEQKIDLGAWQALVTFGAGRANELHGNNPPTGGVLIVQLEKDKFILIGSGCRISFRPLGKNAGKAWQYLKVEEGGFKNGEFRASRILNGDETDWGGPLFGTTPVVLQAMLILR